MKPVPFLILSVSVMALFAAGCKKQQEAPMPTASEPPKSTAPAPAEAQKIVAEATQATAIAASDARAATTNVAQAAATAATNATQTATNAISEATNSAAGTTSLAQGLIERARSLVAEKKYQDALGSLSQLSNLKLTTDQQTQVNDLKAQLQKLMAGQAATDATKNLGGFLDKK